MAKVSHWLRPPEEKESQPIREGCDFKCHHVDSSLRYHRLLVEIVRALFFQCNELTLVTSIEIKNF